LSLILFYKAIKEFAFTMIKYFWKNDQKHGKGTYYKVNKDRYECEYKNDIA